MCSMDGGISKLPAIFQKFLEYYVQSGTVLKYWFGIVAMMVAKMSQNAHATSARNNFISCLSKKDIIVTALMRYKIEKKELLKASQQQNVVNA